MRRGLSSWIFVGAVLIGAVVMAIAYEWYLRKAALPIYGPKQELNGVEQDHVIPEFTLIAQDGARFSSKGMKGKVTVSNFFFTSCPSICPKMMRNLQTVHELYRNDSDVLFVSMTVDPKHDTPERLRMYAEALNANMDQWRFLTGDKREIYQLARHGYFVSAADGDGGELDFIHSENLILADREGRIRGYYNGLDEDAMNELARDIAKLKKEKS